MTFHVKQSDDVRLVTRHDCKWSTAVLDLLAWRLDSDHPAPIDGPWFDPFAGIMHGVERLPDAARFFGMELEPEWAAVHPHCWQGNALNPADYPDWPIGAIVTSPTFGNRMADQYPGRRCPDCLGDGCRGCDETGVDPTDRRYGYAPSLRRRVSGGSSAAMQWGNAYREFHRQWLRVLRMVLDPGPRRLVINMADHLRAEAGEQRRQYVTSWWIIACHEAGFHLAESHPIDTRKMGYGQNWDARTGGEVVMVYDFGR